MFCLVVYKERKDTQHIYTVEMEVTLAIRRKNLEERKLYRTIPLIY